MDDGKLCFKNTRELFFGFLRVEKGWVSIKYPSGLQDGGESRFIIGFQLLAISDVQLKN